MPPSLMSQLSMRSPWRCAVLHAQPRPGLLVCLAVRGQFWSCEHAWLLNMQAQEQLQKLPPPLTDDPNSEFFNRLRDLAQSVSKAAKGYDNAGFFRAVAQLCAEFKQSVLSARPTVRLTSSTNSTSSSRTWQEEDAEFWLEGPEFKGEGEPEGLITLELARQLAAQYRLRELPSFQSYRVLEELVRMLKGRWDAAAIECMRGVGEELQQLTDRLVEEHFGQFAAARTAIR